MKRVNYSIKLSAIALGLAALSGCGDTAESGQVLLTCDVPNIPNAAGTECVPPPPLSCPAPKFPDAKNESCIVGFNPELPEPVAFAGPNQAVLYYNRTKDKDNSANNPNYPGYKLHTWNNDTCDAFAEPHDTTDWANGHSFDGIDPNYGAYWILNLKEGHSECANFIVHIGTEGSGKALGDGDLVMNLKPFEDPSAPEAQYDRANFTIHAQSDVYDFPILDSGFSISDASAHWIDKNIFVWNESTDGVAQFMLHHSNTAEVAVSDEGDISGEQLELIATELSDEVKARIPHLQDWPAYELVLDDEQIKAVAKNQLVIAAYDSDNKALAATNVQVAKVLDALYTAGENDADEATLGVVYDNGNISSALWAPTAQSVTLKVYDSAKNEVASHAMTEDTATGIWSYSGGSELDRMYYRFELHVYHPVSGQMETILATDPYSLNVSTNGRYSQFINLDDADLKPDGWDDHDVPTVQNPEDIIIYEGHVRDFSARDVSTSAANRGKYLAFTEEGSAPVEHLRKLAENGLTHFHLLPLNDIATINEDNAERIDMTDTLAMLCDKIDGNLDACNTQEHSQTIESVLNNFFAGSDDAFKLIDAMRGFDSFNWGYDPQHFIAPEGSYASNADDTSRVKELRAMVQALHQLGLRVVLDVVYNHTSSSGLWDNSVLDKVVPGYYHRYSEISGDIENSTCCENTATEHKMMDKFVADSMVILAQQYGFDSFRFDVMGHMPKSSILAARDAVQAVDPDNYFYGEGWNFGEVADNRLFEQATQANMAGSEVGTFNDRIREAVRGGALFATEQKDDYLRDQDTLRLSMAGNIASYVLKDFNGNTATGNSFSWNSQPTAYALDPADSINYVSKHDNETLWDILQYSNDVSMSIDTRVRVQNIAATLPLMSQGIPFLQMGGDMLRSKSLDRNTYDSGDWFNWVDFSMQTNNWNVGLPLAKIAEQDKDDQPEAYAKMEQMIAIAGNPNSAASMSDIQFASSVFNEFLSIRRDSPLLRLTTAQDIIDRVGFHNIGSNQTQGVIVMSVDDGAGLTDIDSAVDAMVVMVNGSNQIQSHTVSTATGFSLHPSLMMSVDSQVQLASFSDDGSDGTFTVPAYTTAVFVKHQGDTQGAGLSADATAGAPDVVPYGSTEVFVRGGMNGWGEVDAFTYVGGGEYRVAIALDAQSYEFKVASADWSSVDFGALSSDVAGVDEDVAEALARSGANMTFTPMVAGTYVFSLNAADKDNPMLTVYNEQPFIGTNVYIRGGMNGWGETNELVYLGGSIYQAEILVSAATHEFKVASSDWSTVDYGSADTDPSMQLGVDKALAVSGSNMSLNFASEEMYTFTLDMSNRNEPLLTVNKTDMFAGNTVYIRGGMNGWGEVDALNYQGSSVYSVDIALDAGSTEFKVATADWSTVDFGAIAGEEAVIVGDMKMLAKKGANMLIDVATSGTYRFTITGPSTDSPTLMVEEAN
ncbi:pullulanase-type alpha-1,6-glucosidase [Shewanella intestini]|uniref:pullulanase n=1 Tax=Shewanella intestini TaxID=2017544 RepID=A0ABS5I365_9GAMM|nr:MULTISPECIES: pullulanase-type alpha-1,6-glucosidase [Shewanella]MBR9728461.1 pullulanase-type alpha-1,6-glucosidase [Shewanella intestini]MRG36280.1 pullulanase-type alpha-1,6-glucosidase [Shewanella sp. XMDDZSB0408]